MTQRIPKMNSQATLETMNLKYHTHIKEANEWNLRRESKHVFNTFSHGKYKEDYTVNCHVKWFSLYKGSIKGMSFRWSLPVYLKMSDQCTAKVVSARKVVVNTFRQFSFNFEVFTEKESACLMYCNYIFAGILLNEKITMLYAPRDILSKTIRLTMKVNYKPVSQTPIWRISIYR